MNHKSPWLPDLLHESGAHEKYCREIFREQVKKILFCEQCGAPSLEEELIHGICSLCAGRQRKLQ